MKLSDIHHLKAIREIYQASGLITLQEKYDMVRLKNLRKIHRLKRENLTLSARRNELCKKLHKFVIHDKGLYNKHFDFYFDFDKVNELNKISEQMGKNSMKILQLRSEYQQIKPKEIL